MKSNRGEREIQIVLFSLSNFESFSSSMFGFWSILECSEVLISFSDDVVFRWLRHGSLNRDGLVGKNGTVFVGHGNAQRLQREISAIESNTIGVSSSPRSIKLSEVVRSGGVGGEDGRRQRLFNEVVRVGGSGAL